MCGRRGGGRRNHVIEQSLTFFQLNQLNASKIMSAKANDRMIDRMVYSLYNINVFFLLASNVLIRTKLFFNKQIIIIAIVLACARVHGDNLKV